MLTAIITFFIIPVLILSLLVLVHELGHYFVAKKSGVFVEEFGIGLPPKIFSRKIGETIYSINLLPFGGFVKLLGEDLADQELPAAVNPRSFASKSVWARAAILVAGVFMNFVLAVVLYYVFFLNTGFRSFSLPLFGNYNFRFGNAESVNTVVMGVAPESVAESLEIRPGEAIIEIAGVPIRNMGDVRENFRDRVGIETSILLMDVTSFDRDLRTVHAVPVADSSGEGIIGVYIGSTVSLNYAEAKWLSGPKHAYNMLAYSGFVFKEFVSESFSQKTIEPVSSGVAGPVGIFATIGTIVDKGDAPLLGLLDLTALISVSLALINILPLPALDGGRLVFVAYEAVTGRKPQPSFELVVHRLGMTFLLLLIALITVRDIIRLFS